LLLPEEFVGTETVVDHAPQESVNVVVAWDDLEKVLLDRQILSIIVIPPEKVPPLRVYTISDFYEKFLMRVPVFHLNS
jgi:NADPH-dependent ferric siderophore reductase